MTDGSTLKSLHDQFLQAEADLGLFDVTVRGLPFWEWVRFQAFHEVLLVAKGLHEPPQVSVQRTAWNYMGILLRSLLDIAHNPYRAPQSDVLFIGHPRRKKRADGLWWDLYCDPVMDLFQTEPLCLEFLQGLRHHTPCKTKNIRYMDLFSVQMRWRAWRFGPVLRGTEKETLQQLSRQLGERFDCEVDLCALVEQYMKIRFCGLAAYQKLLRRIKPRVVFIVVSYGREVLAAACKTMNIPVVELQHGAIGPHHCAYAYPPGQTKHTFPDYFFSWGERWSAKVPFPLPPERVRPVGYPFLALEQQAVAQVQRKPQVIFISQGTIGRELYPLAVATRQRLDSSIPVIYKLHPGEYARWRQAYPGLAESGIEVLDHDRIGLNHLLATSTTLVGVYSTAVLEGLALGCRVLLADLPGVEAYAELVDSGVVKLIRSAEEIDAEASLQPVPLEPYFKSGWQAAFISALQQMGLGALLKEDPELCNGA